MSAFWRLLTRIWGVAGVGVVVALLAADWGRSGGVIAFQRTSASAVSDIYFLDVTTRVLFRRTQHPGNDRYPAWSPTGDRLVYQAFRPDDYQTETLYTIPFMPSDGPTRVLPTPWVGFQPDWSPDGCCIAFTTANDSYVNNIYVFDLLQRRIWQPFADADMDQVTPVWSPSGERIAFAGARDLGPIAQDRYQIYTAAVTRPPPDNPATRPELAQLSYQGDNSAPAWSPNGDRLYFADVFSPQYAPNLWFATVGQPDVQQLPGPANARFPAVSPDGNWLAFSAQHHRDTNSRVLYISRIDGTNVRPLTVKQRTERIEDNAPAWRPVAVDETS